MGFKRKSFPARAEGWVSAAMARLGAPPEWKIAAAWSSICGARVAEHSTPTSLRSEILTVEVPSSAWASDMIYLRGDLIARIHVHTGLRVKDIRFVPTRADRASRREPSGMLVEPAENGMESVDTPAEVEACVAGVHDPDLKQVLLALGRRVVAKTPPGTDS